MSGNLREEQLGTFYMGKNLKTPLNDDLLLENQIFKAKQEKELKEANEILKETMLEKQKEIDNKAEKLELIPISNKVLILPYPENPYRKAITEGGLIIPLNPQFQNPESGQQDNLKEGIVCAKVIEVGPECKWLKEGDDIYLDIRTTQPVPFYDNGYRLTTELQIMCVLNEGLKARFYGTNG